MTLVKGSKEALIQGEDPVVGFTAGRDWAQLSTVWEVCSKPRSRWGLVSRKITKRNIKVTGGVGVGGASG